MNRSITNWGQERSPENYSRAKRLEIENAVLINAAIKKAGFDHLGVQLGLMAKVKEKTAWQQDLLVYSYSYAKMEEMDFVLRIEVEEKPLWKVDEDLDGASFDKVFETWPWNYSRWSLLQKKIDNVNVEYGDRDVYLLFPYDAKGNTCFWFKFGEVRQGVYENEYESFRRYYRKLATIRKGVYVGFDSLALYLKKIWERNL